LEIFVILLMVTWLLGVVSGLVFEGWIHLLLAMAAVATVLRLTVLRRPR